MSLGTCALRRLDNYICFELVAIRPLRAFLDGRNRHPVKQHLNTVVIWYNSPYFLKIYIFDWILYWTECVKMSFIIKSKTKWMMLL